jgi:Leishmanolysin
MSAENQFYFPGSQDATSMTGDNQSFFVPTEGQFYFSGSQVGISLGDDSKSVFDLQHGIFGDDGAASLASAVDDSGNTHASAFHALDLSIDATAPSIPGDALDGSMAASASGGVYDGADPLTSHTGHVAINHANGLNIQANDTFIIEQLQNQLASLSSDGASAGWAGVLNGDNAQAQHFQTFDAPADAAGPSFDPGGFAGLIDAKGGNGGAHSGGGGGGSGGGGGGGLLTSYTSGDPSVSDANEFNIHIDFGGSWTSQEQAIVTWAADLWSHIITTDVRDDTDLNGNPVDDIAISMNVGRIDGSGNPITGDILAETQITAVRDPGSVDQWLPVTSSILLDSTDLKNSITQGWSGTWDTIIMHEMGHALGFAGIIFDNLGLVDSFGNFTGANAVAAYGTGATSVPLEQDGGSGTAGSHWDEATFAPNGVSMSNELMTGYVVPNEQTYLSDTTVGAMADLGYHVQDPSVGSSYLTIDNHLLLA